MRNKHSGFGVVMVIVAVLALAGLAYGGYRLFNHFNKQTNNVATSNTTNASSQSNKESTTTTTQPTYLDIKEFGIKVPLDSSIADTTYVLDPSQNTNPTEAQTIDVTTKSLAAASDNKCSLLEITRTADQNMTGTPLVPNGSTIFKIGNYYYIFSGQQSLCSTDSNVNQLLHQQSAAFGQDFKAAQLDQ